jgi:hypothetical protein
VIINLSVIRIFENIKGFLLFLGVIKVFYDIEALLRLILGMILILWLFV